MKSYFDLFEFVELIQSRPGSGIVFSLSDGGVEYRIERSKNFGIVIGIPDDFRQAIVIPDYMEMEDYELAREIDPFLLQTSRKNNETYNRNSIKVIALTI